MPDLARRCVDERAALDLFCARVNEVDPDVLTGWNVIDFDLTVLQRIAARLRHPLLLGREPGTLLLRKAEGYFGSGQASIPGRLVLDGIDLLRGAFVRMDEYSLDAVAREVLGEGKAVAGDVGDRIGEILHNYQHDLTAFALYARTDARLAYQILDRLNLIRLACARSQLTGMTPDRVAASIASFDFLYLTELERLAVVAPTVRTDNTRPHPAQQGGHVLEAATGLHRNVWVFDFKSLYPSIIRTFNIDPLSYVEEPSLDADLIRTVSGAFARTPAILPRMLDELFPRREAAKKAGDAVASHAIKILMNSFTVCWCAACRLQPGAGQLHHRHGPRTVAVVEGLVRGSGFTVLYGDTDSLFVDSRATDPAAARTRPGTRRGAQQRTQPIYPGALASGEPPELEFEKLYLKLFCRARQALVVQASVMRAPGRRGRRQHRVHRHGSRAPRLDGARQTSAAGTLPSSVHRSVRRRVPLGDREQSAQWRPRCGARVSQESTQGRG
jgi:DNA polymerase-2